MGKNSKVEAITIYLYNKIIIDNNIRQIKNIRYYLYFIKYVNNNIFNDTLIQTKTHILWEQQESLMMELLLGDKSLKQYDAVLNDSEKQLLDDIYNIFNTYSSDVLRDITFKMIDKNRICDNAKKVSKIINQLNQIKLNYNQDNQKQYSYLCNFFNQIKS